MTASWRLWLAATGRLPPTSNETTSALNRNPVLLFSPELQRDMLPALRHVHRGPAELFADGLGEGGGGERFAVHHESLSGRFLEAAQPDFC